MWIGGVLFVYLFVFHLEPLHMFTLLMHFFFLGKNMSVSSDPQFKNQNKAIVLARIPGERAPSSHKTDIDFFAWK